MLNENDEQSQLEKTIEPSSIEEISSSQDDRKVIETPEENNRYYMNQMIQKFQMKLLLNIQKSINKIEIWKFYLE
ncbi:hypothetical protein CFSAN001627_18803 [Clostridium botulinum CFSAN001627]|uniref:Uncharacterized protein n=1 Tax=Clostridium botulinum CFSAN001627 TaxID=1232189 RepID=M1ZV34_CLOBO|nr:hypothetical protein CFSAN001627_18803 [Clostridium botulinum CFSAN001627]